MYNYKYNTNEFGENNGCHKLLTPKTNEIRERMFNNLKIVTNYTIFEDCNSQQHPEDHSNCTIFSTLNIKTLIEHQTAESPQYVAVESKQYIKFVEAERAKMIQILGLDTLVNNETSVPGLRDSSY